MGLFRNLAGEVRFCLTSADPSGILDRMIRSGITLRDVQWQDDLNVVCTVSREDYRKTSSIVTRRGGHLRILRRSGLYRDLTQLRKRPVFAAGLAVFFFLALWVPSRIFIIEVNGNTTIPANRILEAAADCGISFGASRKAVRSERIKNALLQAMPELNWAGVNTYGCRAVITVHQRQPEPEQQVDPQVSSIVAVRDGFILSCDVVRGNALCRPGQAVAAGEVLISGYTDCGICITATRAEGEVTAATARHLTVLTPAECIRRAGETGRNVKYTLILGKKRINFDNNSGISGESCGRMVTNYHLTLPGGYRMPVTLVKETVSHWETVPGETAPEAMLTDFARRYLGSRMIAGTVTESVETVTEEDGVWVLTGEYACTEMIGRERAEQNGELHETS